MDKAGLKKIENEFKKLENKYRCKDCDDYYNTDCDCGGNGNDLICGDFILAIKD